MGRRPRDFKGEWETSDRPAQPARICSVSGKRMYASEGEAKATAAHRMKDEQNAPEHLRTYLCVYCKAWHLTSKEY